MVLQKRPSYWFNGYQVPTMPRASRSARGKCSFKKKLGTNTMCAFDLLATVAWKLLQEKESSPDLLSVHGGLEKGKDIIKEDQQDVEGLLKKERCCQGSCDKILPALTGRQQRHSNYVGLKGNSNSHGEGFVKPGSTMPMSDRSKQSPDSETFNIKVGSSFDESARESEANSNIGRGFLDIAEPPHDQNYEEFGKQVEGNIEELSSKISKTLPNMGSSDSPMDLDSKPPTLVSSDSSVEVPLDRDGIPGSSPRSQNNLCVVNRDDDENSSGCTQPSTITIKTYRPSHVGYWRVRKLLASKYWKTAPTSVTVANLYTADSERMPISRSRKICYARQRTQKGCMFKRKLYEHCSMSASRKGANSKKKIDLCTMLHGAGGSASAGACHNKWIASGDSHVRLSIKSFKVPELFIEIPETASVGSLKRTVLEAVNTVLGNGLRVGVLVHGKKVGDDSKTLLQSGISCNDKPDSLGFALEPNSAHSPPPLCTENPLCLQPCEQPLPVTGCISVSTTDLTVPGVTPDLPPTNLGNCIESDHDSVTSQTATSLDKTSPNSRALTVFSPMKVDALPVVPLPHKSKHSELVQRRIRRPFSVSEVEALVQAVEKLGTGRWRDVKLCAFENAKHRTYVDLKDKWKTLVHTARISPQQRRGEPVPQELLDRVLLAHAYWSQQQAKQQGKTQREACLLL